MESVGEGSASRLEGGSVDGTTPYQRSVHSGDVGARSSLADSKKPQLSPRLFADRDCPVLELILSHPSGPLSTLPSLEFLSQLSDCFGSVGDPPDLDIDVSLSDELLEIYRDG